MTVAEIIALVKDAIEDESFDDDKILGYVNKGVGRVAAALPLPLLTYESVVTCKANTRRVALPDTYYSNLFHAYNVTKSSSVRIVRPFSTFLSRFPGLTIDGDVSCACVHGRELHYQGAPSSDQVLRVYYTARPEPLSSSDNVECIDEVYQADLLVSYAAAECYKLIENGIEGTKVNYNKWMADYTLALNEYSLSIGPAEDNPDFIPDGDGGGPCQFI